MYLILNIMSIACYGVEECSLFAIIADLIDFLSFSLYIETNEIGRFEMSLI